LKNILFILTFFPLIGSSQAVRDGRGSSSGIQFIKAIELKTGGQSPVFQQVTQAYIDDSTHSIIPNIIINEQIEKAGQIEFKFAQLLETEVEALKNFELLAFINQWLNTPYRFGGNSKNGIDCSGFTGQLMKSVYNTEMPHSAKGQYHAVQKIEKENLSEGDLVFFNTRGGVSHVGVFLKNGYFVHSSTKDGVRISSLNEKYYHRKFIGAGRISLFE
jgi:hypothetical protein